MAVCPFCEKKMPEGVLAAHKKKRHSEELSVKREFPQEEVKKAGFDYYSFQVCKTCLKEVPNILMQFHVHVEHGL